MERVFSWESTDQSYAEAVAYNECLKAGNTNPSYTDDCEGEAWVQYGYLDVAVTTSFPGEAWALGWYWAYYPSGSYSGSLDECLSNASVYDAVDNCVVVYKGSTPDAAHYAGRAQTKGGGWSI